VLFQFVGLRKIPHRALRLIVAATPQNASAGVLLADVAVIPQHLRDGHDGDAQISRHVLHSHFHVAANLIQNLLFGLPAGLSILPAACPEAVEAYLFMLNTSITK
jgi:hypothetical protein